MSPIGKKEREELEMLMPWYVNGTLDSKSSARIEAAVGADPALARSLELLREDADATLALAEADEMPASMEARFMAQLDAAQARDARRATRQAARPGLLSRLGAWIGDLVAASTPRGLALAGASAALVVLLQAGIIVSMLGEGSRPGGFSTASGEAGQEAGAAALVQFAPGADFAAITAFLDQNGARIVDGPLPGGMFKLRLAADDKRGSQEFANLLREQSQHFRLALPSE